MYKSTQNVFISDIRLDIIYISKIIKTIVKCRTYDNYKIEHELSYLIYNERSIQIIMLNIGLDKYIVYH